MSYQRVLKVVLLGLLSLHFLLDLVGRYRSTATFSHVVEHLSWRSPSFFFESVYVFFYIANCTLSVLFIIGITMVIRRPRAPLPVIILYPTMFTFVQIAIMYISSPFLEFKGETARIFDSVPRAPWELWIGTALPLSFVTVCALYFITEGRLFSQGTGRPVPKSRRLVGWAIDLLCMSAVYLYQVHLPLHMEMYHYTVPALEAHPYLLPLGAMFTYYFACEVVFRRSIGKLCTGSQIIFQGNVPRSVLIRTLWRYFPFEALSFLGRLEGWHDRFSRTTVTRATQAITDIPPRTTI